MLKNAGNVSVLVRIVWRTFQWIAAEWNVLRRARGKEFHLQPLLGELQKLSSI